MRTGFRTLTRHTMLTVSVIALLVACDEIGTTGGTESAPPEMRATSVFQKTDVALWDGRPSLGGAWIAHADATTPERVEIRNNKTGKVMTAALFRRERDFPGPSFQLSSDAAAQLGIPAGIPTEVTVTALRRVEMVKPEPAPAATGTTAPAADAAIVATAGAAIDEAMGATGTATEVVVEETSRPGSFFGSKPKNTGVNAPVPAATTAAVAPAAAEPAPRAGSAGSTPGNKPTLVDDAGEPVAEAAPVAPITTTTIAPPTGKSSTTPPATTPPATTPDTTPPATTPPVITDPASEVAPSAAAASALEQATITDLARPFVQVASGSTQSNVLDLSAKLTAAGLKAQIRQTTQEGKVLWYVVVGPAASQAELDANLAKVREMGYPEAYLVKG
jgi:rare lipoprotein A